MSTIQTLTNRAVSELGYPEHASAAALDSFTVNIGSANYTKYARDVGHPNGLPWCQTFIAALFNYCYGREKANKLLCGKLSSASTMEVKEAFKAAGKLVPVSEAREGDIMYRSRSGGGHVGLCIGRDKAGRIITIEGNSTPDDPTSWNGGEVCKHIGGSWQWCARPDYSILEYYATGWHRNMSEDSEDYLKWWYQYGHEQKEYYSNQIVNIGNKYYAFDSAGYLIECKGSFITDASGAVNGVER